MRVVSICTEINDFCRLAVPVRERGKLTRNTGEITFAEGSVSVPARGKTFEGSRLSMCAYGCVSV